MIRVDDFPGTKPAEFDRHNLESFKRFHHYLTSYDDFRYVLPKYCGPLIKRFSDGTRTATFPDRGWPIPAIKWIEKKLTTGKGIYNTHCGPALSILIGCRNLFLGINIGAEVSQSHPHIMGTLN